MNNKVITGEPLTAQDVRAGVYSYTLNGQTFDINGELYYNKKEERFEHQHDDSTLIVWPYSF